MTTFERYNIDNGSVLKAAYVPQLSESDTVAREAEFHHLDALITTEPGIPSTATIKRIVARQGKLCQVCWRSRWFRAEVLSVYSIGR